MRSKIARLCIALILSVNLLSGCNLPKPANPEVSSSNFTLTGTPESVPTTPVSVSILNPINGTTLPISSQVDLRVLITGAQAPLTVELWHNGQLLGERNYSIDDFQTLFTIPWTVNSQESTITLVVKGEGNSAGISNAVTIYSSPPVPGTTVFPASAGDSRQSISEEFAVPVENVEVDNLPDYDPRAEIPQDTLVTVNFNGGEMAEQTPTQIPLPDGFNPPVGEQNTLNAPEITGTEMDGGIKLTFASPSEEVKALVVYRADHLSGEFIPVFNQPVETTGQVYEFTDPEGKAEINSYFILGVTGTGIEPGNIFQLDLSSGQPLLPQQAAVIPTGDGRLRIMEGVGIVYFYASLNHAQSVRVPENGFYQVQDGMVDLNNALASLTGEAQFPAWLDMEVWTWTGTTAQLLGAVHTWLDKTTLAVCVDTNQRCDGAGNGEFYSRELTEGVANTDIPGGTDFEFPWKTSLSSNPQANVQVSLSPFSDQYDPEPQGMVYSAQISGQCTQYGCGSVFSIEFANLLNKPNDGSLVLENLLPLTVDSLTNIPQTPSDNALPYEISQKLLQKTVLDMIRQTEFKPGDHLTDHLVFYPINYYVRVTPMVNGQPSGSPSNTVLIKYGPMGSSSTVQYFPTVSPPPQPEQVYDAKIIEFDPPIPPSLDWGCVYITSVKPGVYNEANFRYLMQHHEPYCPTNYQGMGSESWYESFWNFATGAVDWISQKYAELKAGVVSQIAGLLDSAGLCNDCEAYISAALDAGLVALGIPPELPDFSKLSDAGIDYLIQEAAEGMGVPCDQSCMDILRDGVHKLADDMNAQVVSSYEDTEEAHNHGKNPLYIPSGVTVEPAKESNWQMASLRIQVSRKPGTENISMAELSAIESTLFVTVEGYNDRTGQAYTVYNCFSGGCDLINPSPECHAVAVPGCPETRHVAAPLEGELFKPNVFTLGSELLPHLQPGETRELNLVLLPSVFWIPGHETQTTYSWYDDWGYLYEGGIGKFALDITAMACLPNISGYPPSCSYTYDRTDYWQIDLPDTATWGYNQMWQTK
jgi:hypothetical protein